MLYFFYLIGFVFSVSLEAPVPLFSVDNKTWYNVDFYEHVFKDDWDVLSVDKKTISDEWVFHSRNVSEIVDYVLKSKKRPVDLSRSKRVQKEVFSLLDVIFKEIK